ncbi:MAG: tRNA threonylcarbamoyladenosine dehydratase [Clostridia bacterium]|nr:tRNA threonylcarbamoyladenosine dehydratase [Clostridia bacterium]MBQ5957205.1 tRNA threonylcarbamoyladenosine dehydratase [Clostridia bacterium]
MDLSRLEMVIGKENIEKLKNSHVAVFGLGGVGSYACEAVTRSGVGTITIVDKDTVSSSNVNRQLIAFSDNVGELKTSVMKERMLRINPDVNVIERPVFFLQDTADGFDFREYDYVIDAIDNITAKLLLISMCKEAGTPIISSMGTGNKMDPSRFEVADIYSTSVCPLAKVMRRELKKRGIDSLKVVYSREEPLKNVIEDNGSRAPGSTAFVPPVAGMIMASEAIKELIGL